MLREALTDLDFLEATLVDFFTVALRASYFLSCSRVASARAVLDLLVSTRRAPMKLRAK